MVGRLHKAANQPVRVCKQGLWDDHLEASTCVSIASTRVICTTTLWQADSDAAAAAHRPTARSEWLLAITAKGG